MGNSANWPLMRTITESSGGFYASVSNADDIIGQIMLAKSKITFEALHDVSLNITGVPVSDLTDDVFAKVYRGQQLVIFGRYAQAGTARVTLKARLTGEDRAYTTSFTFPAVDTENPELERLWALARVAQLEARGRIGALAAAEMEGMIRDLGVTYQSSPTTLPWWYWPIRRLPSAVSPAAIRRGWRRSGKPRRYGRSSQHEPCVWTRPAPPSTSQPPLSAVVPLIP